MGFMSGLFGGPGGSGGSRTSGMYPNPQGYDLDLIMDDFMPKPGGSMPNSNNASVMSAPPGAVAPVGGLFTGIGPSSVDGVGSMVNAQADASTANAVSRGLTPMGASQAPPLDMVDPFAMSPSDSIVADGGGFMGTLGRIGEGIGTAFDGIDQGIGALSDSALVSGFRGAMDTIGNSPLGDIGRGFSNGMAAYRGEDPMFPGDAAVEEPMSEMTIEALEALLAQQRQKQAGMQ